MIVKMKKYSFIVYYRQYNSFLEKLRETGVLHVIERPEGVAENDALREKMQLAARVKNAIKLLEKGNEAVMSIRNFGEKSLDELRQKMQEKGFLQNEKETE